MSNKLKQFTLDDGSITNAEIVAKRTGCSIKNSRVRLAMHTNPKRIYKPKQIHNSVRNDNYKLRSIKGREASIYNEMFVLVFKTI
ncbi:hypothetical protein [Candidatus Thioglobus sp.]|jgi:hypothetical protein|uniref:hypothetical protein n=1 Tax=Candidatus Thioglobus sp. TaxID=2026721 RepID=UPI002616A542|nr:hypothetical protein [Candidatus Thioglobus sp.]